MALKSGRVGIHPSQVDPITGMLLSSPGGASDLSDLDDVSIDNPELGQLLVYDGNKWENQFASISPVTPATLASLQDVTIDNPAAGQSLIYNGTGWENEFSSISPTTLSALQDVQITDVEDGEYLVYDATNSKWINSASAPTPVTPEGSTVLPTDDIQIWLACAAITDKTYTTLNEVLADSTTLLALISSNNASDYLVRSTTWASGIAANSTAMTDIGANDYCAAALLANSTWCDAICNSTYFESVLTTKVPTMTSNTTPSGEVLFDNDETAGGSPSNLYYYLFDNSTAVSSLVGTNASITSQYFGYDFGSGVDIHKIGIYGYHDSGTITGIKLQGSNDGITWNDVYTIGTYTSGKAWTYYNAPNSSSYSKWRLNCEKGTATSIAFIELQFYGR